MFNQSNQSSQLTTKSFLHKVYAWMSAGLLVTAGVSYYVAHTPALLKYIFSNPMIIIGLVILQLLLVGVLSFAINKMSYMSAALLFIAYSALTGLTLSSIFLVYTYTSIAVTFLVAAGMFLAMALYGYFTDADLSKMGNYLFMGVIGLVLAGLLNFIFKSTGFDFLISAAGVVIFSLLTAYDVQSLKVLSYQLQGQDSSKVSIIGALKLYLDFINLFLYLLRFMGQKKEN